MKLNYITIMVRDIEKSLVFYQELVGLQLVRRFNPGQGEIAFLVNKQDETMIELIQFEHMEKVSATGMIMSYSAGDKLAQVREKTLALGYEPTEIVDAGPKPTYFRVADPDGIIVEFSVQ